MFFRRLLLRLKLRWLEYKHTKQETWELTPAILLEIANTIDMVLVSNIKPRVACEVYASCSFSDVNDMLKFLNGLSLLFERGEYVEDAILRLLYGRKPITLDALLATNNHLSVRPAVFLKELRVTLQRLNQCFENTKGGDDFRAYYLRKVRGVHEDVFAVLEALSIAALTR